VVVARAVGREAAARGGELGADGFFHHRELQPRPRAHRVAAAHRLEGPELAQPGRVRGEQPDPGRPRQAQNRRPGREHHEAAGAHVHARRADPPAHALRVACQERGGLRAVEDADAQALKFPVERGLEGRAPHAQREFVAVVVGEHQAGLFVPEGRAQKLARGVADLSAEGFDVEKPVPALAALDVVADAVGVSVLLADVGLGDLEGRHQGARVGAGRLPVVKAAAGRAAADRCPLLDQRDLRAPPRRRDGREAAGEAAAQHQHVRLDQRLLADLAAPGPFDAVHPIPALRSKQKHPPG